MKSKFGDIKPKPGSSLGKEYFEEKLWGIATEEAEVKMVIFRLDFKKLLTCILQINMLVKFVVKSYQNWSWHLWLHPYELSKNRNNVST